MKASPPPFQSFLEEHRQPVLAFLWAAVGPDEAEDCFQETFLAALRAYPRLEASESGELRGWILTIAQRKAIDFHRARARRATTELVGDRDPSTSLGMTMRASVEMLDGQPELWRAVAALPPKQRAAVAHRFVGDLAYRDIGRIVGCSEEAARQSVREGLKKIREVWSQ